MQKHNHFELKDKSDEDLVLIAQTARKNNDEQNPAIDFLLGRFGWLPRFLAKPFFLPDGGIDDVIQEGNLGLFKAIRDYNPVSGKFFGFAQLCIKRQIITALKTSTRQKHFSLNSAISLDKPVLTENGDEASLYDKLVCNEDSPEQILLSKEETNYLKEVFGIVLSDFEEDVSEAYIRGMTYVEIADELGCGLKSVDNALQRAKRKSENYIKSKWGGEAEMAKKVKFGSDATLDAKLFLGFLNKKFRVIDDVVMSLGPTAYAVHKRALRANGSGLGVCADKFVVREWSELFPELKSEGILVSVDNFLVNKEKPHLPKSKAKTDKEKEREKEEETKIKLETHEICAEIARNGRMLISPKKLLQEINRSFESVALFLENHAELKTFEEELLPLFVDKNLEKYAISISCEFYDILCRILPYFKSTIIDGWYSKQPKISKRDSRVETSFDYDAAEKYRREREAKKTHNEALNRQLAEERRLQIELDEINGIDDREPDFLVDEEEPPALGNETLHYPERLIPLDSDEHDKDLNVLNEEVDLIENKGVTNMNMSKITEKDVRKFEVLSRRGNPSVKVNQQLLKDEVVGGTISAFAAEHDISYQAVYAILNGRQETIRIEDAIKLAQGLDSTDLFELPETGQPIPKPTKHPKPMDKKNDQNPETPEPIDLPIPEPIITELSVPESKSFMVIVNEDPVADGKGGFFSYYTVEMSGDQAVLDGCAEKNPAVAAIKDQIEALLKQPERKTIIPIG